MSVTQNELFMPISLISKDHRTSELHLRAIVEELEEGQWQLPILQNFRRGSGGNYSKCSQTIYTLNSYARSHVSTVSSTGYKRRKLCLVSVHQSVLFLSCHTCRRLSVSSKKRKIVSNFRSSFGSFSVILHVSTVTSANYKS